MDSAGSLLSLSQTNVPQDREKSTLKLLNRVWRALGGIAVQNVVHAVFVPDNRARVWKTVSEAKHVRENVPQGGSEFKMFGSLLHGSHKGASSAAIARLPSVCVVCVVPCDYEWVSFVSLAKYHTQRCPRLSCLCRRSSTTTRSGPPTTTVTPPSNSTSTVRTPATQCY